MIPDAHKPLLGFLLLNLLLQLSLAQSNAPTSTSQSLLLPTADANTPSAKVNPNVSLPFLIIDKEWTQLFIGMGSILLAFIGSTSLYGFVWVPWWRSKMVEAEKVYNRMEKERLAGAKA